MGTRDLKQSPEPMPLPSIQDEDRRAWLALPSAAKRQAVAFFEWLINDGQAETCPDPEYLEWKRASASAMGA